MAPPGAKEPLQRKVFAKEPQNKTRRACLKGQTPHKLEKVYPVHRATMTPQKPFKKRWIRGLAWVRHMWYNATSFKFVQQTTHEYPVELLFPDLVFGRGHFRDFRAKCA
jgi:hypothetical protein